LGIWVVEGVKVLEGRAQLVLILEIYLAICDEGVLHHNDLNLTSEISSEDLVDNEHRVHIKHKK
jgi:hypothetical protein